MELHANGEPYNLQAVAGVNAKIWFLVAFAISIAIAFIDLGDETTAYSLAFGLLLSWLPILVVMAIVDRNLVGSSRCQVLIERWLHDVDRILNDPNHLNEEFNGDLWRPGTLLNFRIGLFVGQGRRLGYCGLAYAVLHFKNDIPSAGNEAATTFTTDNNPA